jgi:hypothetical protein
MPPVTFASKPPTTPPSWNQQTQSSGCRQLHPSQPRAELGMTVGAGAILRLAGVPGEARG